MLRIMITLAFLLSCNNELLFCLNIAYGKFHGMWKTRKNFNIHYVARSSSSSLPSHPLSSDALIVDKPYFVENPQNITALNNDSVTLKCTVKNKKNRTVRIRYIHCEHAAFYTIFPQIIHTNKFLQVSWIRKRDLAILTSNTFVYTSDARFSVIHISESDNWDLRVKPLSERDRGLYVTK